MDEELEEPMSESWEKSGQKGTDRDGRQPPDQDERERADFDAAITAVSLSPRSVRRLDNGDGSSQLVAVGEAPTGRPGLVALLLVLATTAAVGFVVVYWVGGQHQLEGSLLGGSLLLIGVALVAWSKRLLPETLSLETRPDLAEGDHEALGDDLARPELEMPGRRMLISLLAGAGAALAAALVFPLRSLGPRPRGELARTSWRPGSRLVTADGTPVHQDDIALDGALTVFPETHTDAADSQVMLVRVPHRLLSTATIAGGVVDGRVAYSKVCTHAGCPVGQFRVDHRSPDTSYELLCPCHQSLFDVLEGCRVLAGPAATPLPQLPLATDDAGFLIATGDFPSPIGPSYWNEP
jgi:ubiquinol-cytochrome c reductase iron-sulfur subunit